MGLLVRQPATDPGAHLLELSVVGVQLGFQVWVPRLLMVVRTHPGALCLWVGQLASAPGAHPLEVSGVGPQSANLGERQLGFR